jgi:hypothetical protein
MPTLAKVQSVTTDGLGVRVSVSYDNGKQDSYFFDANVTPKDILARMKQATDEFDSAEGAAAELRIAFGLE